MPAAPSKPRWGDDANSDSDSDDESTSQPTSLSTLQSHSSSGTIKIPPTHTSAIDPKTRTKTVTSYRANPNKPGSSLIKTVSKIRVHVTQVREHVDVEARRSWKKFGQAASSEDQANVTVESRDDVYVEDPNADVDLQEEDVTKALAGNLNAFWEKQRLRQVERKYDISSDDLKDPAAGGGGGEAAADGWMKVGDKPAGAAPAGNKYVPPSARGGAPGAPPTKGGGAGSLAAMAGRLGDSDGGPDKRLQDNRDQNTIRVTNISEDTTEADLQELFGRFGRISRVYVAKDKETLQSRGFAFVSFTQREEAAKAMDKLQGYGYDHLILKLEWARPSAPKDSSTQYRSGYGQALAQDTKAKVSYASNLTR